MDIFKFFLDEALSIIIIIIIILKSKMKNTNQKG